MRWLNDLKIRKKLLLSFGVVITLMIVLTIYSAANLFSINKIYGNLTDATSKRLTDLTDALETLVMLQMNNIATAYPYDDEVINKSLMFTRRLDYDDLCDTFLRYLNYYYQHVRNDKSLSPDIMQYRLKYISEVENLFINDYKPCYYKIREGIIANDKYAISDGLQKDYEVATDITTLINDLREMAIDFIDIELDRISLHSNNIIYTLFLVAAGIILLSIFASVFMSKKIENPIYALENAATKIAGGDLNYPIRNDNKDELGILSKRIGEMVDTLKNVTQAKSAFLANMSHDMRTPLNVVVGLTNLRLEDKDLSPEITEDLKKINSAGELLLALVNDLLDISKIEAGKLELVPVDYHSASLLNDIITLNIIRIQSKPIHFQVNISENLPRVLCGDEIRVKQILNNLLSNAFKYTKEGTVTLDVQSDCLDGGETTLLFTVSDTGIGIRPEDIKKLFSEYNQVDIKANRKIEGTGLGLSITKKLAEMMNGEITVESEYGKGSSFRVSVRQKLLNNETLGKETVEKLRNFRYSDEKQLASSGIVRPDLSYARVLVVDDFPTNLDVAAGMLGKYKMQVDCIGSGQAALDIIRKGEPVYDAVFMDHMMPEMDGIEATQLIRGLDSEYARTVPIISLTANALTGNEQMFLEKGFNAFLSKPINIVTLDSIVKKWVRKKNPKPLPADEKQPAENPPDELPGINSKAALALYGDDNDMLIFAFGSFCKHTPALVDTLRNVTKENLPDYAINVHSLKSAFAAIGAEDLSARAKKLELLAKSGDLSGVLAENDALLRDAGTMIENVQNRLNSKTAK